MDRVAHITALEVSLARAVEILDRLGFDPRAGQGTIDVRVPTTRFVDVTREIDVIEEIARIYGLEHVPSLLSVGSGGGLTRGPARAPHGRRRLPRRRPDRGADALLRARGHARPPRPRPGRPAPHDARGRQPALAGALAPAHAAPAEPARGARAQRRLGPRRPRAVRDRAHLPPRRGPEAAARAVDVRRGHARPPGRCRLAARGRAGLVLPRQGRARVDPGRRRRDLPRRGHATATATRSCTPGARASCRCRASRRSASSASCTR